MRLVTFLSPSGPRLGVLHHGSVIDPARVLEADATRRRTGSRPDALLPAEMVAFFQGGADTQARATTALELADAAIDRGDALVADDGITAVFAETAVRLLAPVPRPRRIRDYLTYTGHAKASGLPVPDAMQAMPICYKCNIETVIGPDEPLLWPSYTKQLDFELELGFFTAGGGVDLTPKEAQGLIAGVTIFNDVSARDIQMFEMGLQIGPSKGKDFCTAMGPAVLTIDEVDEWAVTMQARVNGEEWVTGITRDRQFSMAEMLAWASLDEPVYPGEFLALGTVGGGSGLELDRWIAPGDVVELEASGVGVLRNTVGTPRVKPPDAGLPSYSGAPEHHVQHA